MDQEIIENNKLISEFMGELSANHLWKSPSSINPERFWVSQEYQGIEDPDGNDLLFPSDMKFHKSWDWLMPVVEKIEEIGYFVMINKWTSVYTGSEQDRIQITTVEGKSKITNTFIAIVEFIKWYNQNNK